MTDLYVPQNRPERLIAAGRVVLAASSLFAVWLDPSEPAKYARVAYFLLAAYLAYSVLIALALWRFEAPSRRARLATHLFDLHFFSLFIYFTAGAGSPFTAFFVFSLVCAALRWGWRGTAWTAAASLAALLAISVYFGEVVDDPDFQLHTSIIRGVYLAVVAMLLGYLGAHEEQTRRELSLLAAWPQEVPAGAVGARLDHWWPTTAGGSRSRDAATAEPWSATGSGPRASGSGWPPSGGAW